MSGVFLAGVGRYIPAGVVTNDDMSKIVDTSDEWISERTGIRERHFSNGEPTWFMGAEAAKAALQNAGVNACDIDMIIGCSISADYFFPSMSCIVQGVIGADNAFCWDLSAACSGFVYALDAAEKYLCSGSAKNILIICSEMLSRLIDFTDRSTCVLFGDGAAAVVVQRSEDKIFKSYMRSEGKLGGAIVSSTVESKSPYAADKQNAAYQLLPQTKEHYLSMAGRDVYRFATRALPESIQRVCEDAGWSYSELKYIIPHQANQRILETAMEKLGLGMDKVYLNLNRYGNTSSASIPICLSELADEGMLSRGDKMVFSGFGGGLTYGAVALEW